MELVVIVLNKTDLLTDILTQFVNEDIEGATVIDSSGMGRLVADYFPMFSMFAEMEKDKESTSKTIFTVVHSEEERGRVLKALENVVGDITVPDTAIFFTLPVGFAKGF